MRRWLLLITLLAMVALTAIASLDRAHSNPADDNAADGVATPTPTFTPSPPMLGNYPDTTVVLGANTLIVPSSPPSGTTNIQVAISPTSFLGLVSADPVTGIVRVTNAHHANLLQSGYQVTLRAFGPGGVTTSSFELLVTEGNTCTQSSVFNYGSSVTVGNLSYSVAVTDFNNDGVQDLAITNNSASTRYVSIRLGNGQGQFTGNLNIPAFSSNSVAVADLNGDGNQDLAVSGPGGQVGVAVHWGDGHGNFTQGPSIGANASNVVAIVDFNQDGAPDIVFAEFSGTYPLAIWLGDGRGGFTSGPTASVGGKRIAIGDFNNDGFPDLAVGNDLADRVYIVLNDGIGGIASITPLAGASITGGVAVGDFNLDGNQDLVITYGQSALVATRLGDGSGGFGDPAYLSVDPRPSSVAVGDFNNDGRQDLAITHGHEVVHPIGSVSIRFGDGLGGFVGGASLPNLAAPSRVAVGDFNADGRQDLIVTTARSSIIAATVFLGGCVAPSPTPTPPCSLTQGFDNSNPPGWNARNLSEPSGTFGWSFCNCTLFPPHSGSAFTGVGSAATSGSGTISAWLISPVVDLRNGGVFTFYTRTKPTVTRPDRMQARLSINGDSLNVGSTATSVGDFDTLLLDINPNYTLTGYPNEWTRYDLALTGITEPAAGRVAFRYFVENGGSGGPNSDYIGLDTFSYSSGACPTPTPGTPSPTPSGGPPTPTPVLPTPTPSSPGGGGTPTPSPSLPPIASPTPTPSPPPPPPINFTSASYYGDEGHAATIVVQTGGSLMSSSVSVVSFGGTAVGGNSCSAGVDYITVNQRVGFAPRFPEPARVDVVICSDDVAESIETIELELRNPENGVLVVPFITTLYIRNPFTPFDFDGDRKADVSVFRPSVGEWYYQRSTNGVVNGFGFGTSTDRPVPADFTGDGKTDIAFFRPLTGDWYVLRSEDSTYYAFPFGTPGDIPAPADFDGDGEADPTVYRPSAQTWFILRSTGGVSSVPFGLPNDVPVPADYDGDGLADIGIFRPDVGQWWNLRSSNGGVFAATFGSSTDKPVPGDYTGDGHADVAFYRPSEGTWYVLRSEDQSFFAFPFGNSTDKPAPADFDGDGIYDAAVFRPSDTNWYILKSTGGVQIQQFGLPDDIPLPGAFIP